MKKILVIILAVLLIPLNVFAKDEVKVSNLKIDYDKESGIVINNDSTKDFNVTLNDLDQSVTISATLTNTTDKTIKVKDIKVSTPTYNFTNYNLTGIKLDDEIESNKSIDIKVKVSTKANKDMVENFKDNIKITVIAEKKEIEKITKNPPAGVTSALLLVVIWLIISLVSGIFIKRKNHPFKSLVLVIPIITTITAISVKADEQIVYQLNGIVSFKSQNVIEQRYLNGKYGENQDFWEHGWYIHNIHIENKVREIKNYKEKYDVSDKKDGRVIAYLVLDNDYMNEKKKNNDQHEYYELYIMTNGALYLNPNSSNMFASFSNASEFTGIEYIRSDYATTFENMFNYYGVDCGENIYFDFSKWNTSNVTDMSGMFGYLGGSKNESIKINLNNWNLSKVETMKKMFMDLGYYNKNKDYVLSLSLENWDVSHVKDFNYMFECLGRYQKHFEFELSGWTFNEESNVSQMFMNYGAEAEYAKITLKNMKFLNGAAELFRLGGSTYEGTLIMNLENFEIHKRMDNMFSGIGLGGKKEKDIQLNIKNWDTKDVTSMSYMFGSSTGLRVLDLSSFDTRNVENMQSIFQDNSTIEKIYVSDKWSTDNIKDKNQHAFSSYSPLIGYDNPEWTVKSLNYTTGYLTLKK